MMPICMGLIPSPVRTTLRVCVVRSMTQSSIDKPYKAAGAVKSARERGLSATEIRAASECREPVTERG